MRKMAYVSLFSLPREDREQGGSHRIRTLGTNRGEVVVIEVFRGQHQASSL